MALLDRDDSVLVVVDAQPGFLPDGAEQAIERMAWLVAVAARLGIPAVVTEEEPDRNGATDARVAERLPAGTRVFTKPTFGLAGTPEILEAVRTTGRGTAVVVGCETDVCVAQSAVGLQAAGFTCVVVEDATFSPGEMHERGLARLASEGVARNHAKGRGVRMVAHRRGCARGSQGPRASAATVQALTPGACLTPRGPLVSDTDLARTA